MVDFEALAAAGAGNIGEYESCSFQHSGIGTFKPSKNANPHIGEAEKLEHVQENKIEVIDFLEDQKLDFRAANVVKYVIRYTFKDGLQDL